MNYAVPIALAEANVRLGELCEKVIEDRDMILIHQPNGQDVALIAFEELNGLLNTLQRARSGIEKKSQNIDHHAGTITLTQEFQNIMRKG